MRRSTTDQKVRLAGFAGLRRFLLVAARTTIADRPRTIRKKRMQLFSRMNSHTCCSIAGAHLRTDPETRVLGQMLRLRGSGRLM